MTTESTERRQIGVMPIFHRTKKGELYIPLAPDFPKLEISAGLRYKRYQFIPGEKRYNILGSGGQETPNEPRDVAKARELREELREQMVQIEKPDIFASLSSIFSQHSLALANPFIVAQFKSPDGHPDKISQINKFAVVGTTTPFDVLPREIQRGIEGIAEWVLLSDIMTAFQIARKTGNYRIGELPVRPQVLTAGAIFALQECSQNDILGVQQTVTRWNRNISDHIHLLAQRRGAHINNGTMTRRGTLYKNLSRVERAFLT